MKRNAWQEICDEALIKVEKHNGDASVKRHDAKTSDASIFGTVNTAYIFREECLQLALGSNLLEVPFLYRFLTLKKLIRELFGLTRVALN